MNHQYYWKGTNKDIRKYINQCALCCREKAKSSSLPSMYDRHSRMSFWKDHHRFSHRMQNLPFRQQTHSHLIDHLSGWPEAFPIPDKSADSIVTTFINQYLPVNMWPRYIPSDNGTEFKNHFMDQVLQQLGIEHIFSTPYHPQINRKLEVFTNTSNPPRRNYVKKIQQIGTST